MPLLLAVTAKRHAHECSHDPKPYSKTVKTLIPWKRARALQLPKTSTAPRMLRLETCEFIATAVLVDRLTNVCHHRQPATQQ